MAQKRNYDRMLIPGTVFLISDPMRHECAQATLEEMSSRGMSFVCPKSFEVGASVLLDLVFDFLDTRFSCKGTIRNVTSCMRQKEPGYRIGIELSEFDQEMFNSIMSGYNAYKKKMHGAAGPGHETLY